MMMMRAARLSYWVEAYLLSICTRRTLYRITHYICKVAKYSSYRFERHFITWLLLTFSSRCFFSLLLEFWIQSSDDGSPYNYLWKSLISFIFPCLNSFSCMLCGMVVWLVGWCIFHVSWTSPDEVVHKICMHIACQFWQEITCNYTCSAFELNCQLNGSKQM